MTTALWHGDGHIGMGLLVVAMVACCMRTCVTDDGLALCSNKNADAQIRSSQGPSIGLVEGPHEGVNSGTQCVNGVLYIPVHHSKDDANKCNWKLASFKEAAIYKCPGFPELIRASVGQARPTFFHCERAIVFHFSVANNLASFRFLGRTPNVIMKYTS